MTAIEDYRVYLSWRTSTKRKKLRRKLGADAVIAIEDLWGWCAETPARRDGNLHGMSPEDIADACDYEGDPEALVAALVDARLLDVTPEGFAVHNYAKRQPWVAGANHRQVSGSKNAFARQHALGRHKNNPKPGCPECESSAAALPLQSDSKAVAVPPEPDRTAESPPPIAAARNPECSDSNSDSVSISKPNTTNAHAREVRTPAVVRPHSVGTAAGGGGRACTKSEFDLELSNGITTQVGYKGYKALQRVEPTLEELRAAADEARAGAAKIGPSAYWADVQERGSFVIGIVERHRKDAAGTARKPKRVRTYDQGTTVHEVGDGAI